VVVAPVLPELFHNERLCGRCLSLRRSASL
jgi:hypothetical protein